MRALAFLGLAIAVAACGDSDTVPPGADPGDASDSSLPHVDGSDSALPHADASSDRMLPEAAPPDTGTSPGDAASEDEKPVVDGASDGDGAASDAATGDGDAATSDGDATASDSRVEADAVVTPDAGMDVSVGCSGGTIDCAGNGNCVDLQTSPLHCGRCQHDCLGGLCQAAQCQPVPIATGMRSPMGVVVVGDDVYATDFGVPPEADGALIRIAPNGTVTTLEDNLTAPHSLWYDQASSRFLFPNYFGAAIYTRPLQATDGGAVSPYISSSLGFPLGIATNQDNVFVVNYGGVMSEGQQVIQRRRRSDLVEDANFSEYPAGPTHLDIDSTFLYWAEFVAGRIVRMPLNVTPSVSAVQVIVANVPTARGIAVDGSTIYFTTYSTPLIDGGPLFGTVQSVDNSLGATPTKLVTMPGQLEDVAVDAKAIYVAGRGNGTVWRIAK